MSLLSENRDALLVGKFHISNFLVATLQISYSLCCINYHKCNCWIQDSHAFIKSNKCCHSILHVIICLDKTLCIECLHNHYRFHWGVSNIANKSPLFRLKKWLWFSLIWNLYTILCSVSCDIFGNNIDIVKSINIKC